MKYVPAILIEKDGSPLISRPQKIDFLDAEHVLLPTGTTLTISDQGQPNIFLSFISFSGSNTTRYFPIYDSEIISPPTVSGTHRLYFGSGGTIKNLYVGKKQTSGTTDVTVTLVVNGVDSALTVTVNSGTSWNFGSDTTNEVTISANDYVEYKIVYGNGATQFVSAKMEFYRG